MSVEQFLDTVERGEIPPVVALGGAERVLVDEALANLRARVLTTGVIDFNHDRVSARDRTADDIVHLANMLPTLAPRRLVEVHDCETLEPTPALERYLDQPPAETCLVLVFGQIDVRRKLPKRLQKAALFGKFDHPKEREMPGLVRRRARRHKLEIDDEGAEVLALTVGADLGLLERAFEKLALVTDGRAITVAEIAEHVADTHVEDAFAFGRAILIGDRPEALRALAALERDRAAPIQLLGLLAWQLRQAVRARDILDSGGNPERVRSELRLFGDRASAVLSAARRFDADQHRRRLLRIADVDEALKSSRASSWLWLSRLALELCPERR